MLKRIISMMLSLFLISSCAVIGSASDSTAEQVCEHSYGKWQKKTPALIFRNEVQKCTCEKCGAEKTAFVPSTALIYRFASAITDMFTAGSNYDLPDGFTVTAHSGSMAAPENSIFSIKTSINSGADVIEFDLNFTEDGKAVLAHGTPKGNEPTLEEAFAVVAEYKDVKVNVDVKNTADLGIVQELAIKYDILDRIFYTGIGSGWVKEVKEKSPLVPYYLNCSPSTDKDDMEAYCRDFVAEAKALGAIGLNMNYNSASPEIIAECHRQGMLVSLWTAIKKEEIKTVLSFAPDNITTKRPYKAIAMK